MGRGTLKFAAEFKLARARGTGTVVGTYTLDV